MAGKTLTFKVSDALRAAQTDPNGCLELSLQKSKKTYTCTYLDMKFKAGNVTSNGLWIRVGGLKDQVNSGGFVIVANVLDSEKAKEKYKDDPENQRMRITTAASKAGDFGLFALALTPIFKGKAEALAATGVVNIKNRTINGFAQTHMSDDHKDPELRGKPLDDPLSRVVIDFSEPKEWYRKGFAWGKTVTQFLDYNKAYADDEGVVRYSELTWTNADGVEETINATNVHRVITAGSIVHDCTIWYGNASISKAYVSSKATMTRCVIEVIDNTIEAVAEPDFGDKPVTTAATIVTAAEVTGETVADGASEPVTATATNIDDFVDSIC